MLLWTSYWQMDSEIYCMWVSSFCELHFSMNIRLNNVAKIATDKLDSTFQRQGINCHLSVCADTVLTVWMEDIWGCKNCSCVFHLSWLEHFSQATFCIFIKSMRWTQYLSHFFLILSIFSCNNPWRILRVLTPISEWSIHLKGNLLPKPISWEMLEI